MKAEREQILIRTSWTSTIGNAILSTSKIIVGLWAGSLAVLGDGIDSATDVIISIVMIFTARIISQPPSKKYVFGYEKAEGGAGVTVGMNPFNLSNTWQLPVTSFSYVLLRLKGFIPTVTPAPPSAFS